LAGENKDSIKRIILTGSGGPFLNRQVDNFHSITIEEALAHPNWKMGKKITIDSATLINKGLEIIEAHWLFGLALDQIDLVIHPQSIIHSMVEFQDGSIKAQLGWPDMKIPIQYSLTYPERYPASFKKLDFATLKELTFIKPDLEKFPNLRLAIEAIKSGGVAPAVLNAANEEAVHLFLSGVIQFPSIAELIEDAIDNHSATNQPDLEQILSADRWARNFVFERVRMRKSSLA
ncbi:MAG: 1-deoxy-D-xylulose-5-phosphate reductoisomerase, partial [bacterium]